MATEKCPKNNGEPHVPAEVWYPKWHTICEKCGKDLPSKK